MHSSPQAAREATRASEPAPTADLGLAARLREATAPQHRDAETRGFITRLMGGALNLEAYTAYLGQYAHIYQALEARAARQGDPELLHWEGLARMEALESDLAHLGAAEWRVVHPPLDATQAYVDRLRSLGSDDVPRYLAHHYTRYLGDLSGGQAIAKLVARHYGAADDQLAFYLFDGMGSAVHIKRAYREGLDALDLGHDGEAALIEEAQLAFTLNADLFDALDTQASLRVE